MPKSKCTWRKEDGRYFCEAKHCPHWREQGCALGKVTLTCDNEECQFHGILNDRKGICACMDVHLDADGKCLSFRKKTR